MPNDGDLVDTLLDFAPDETVRRKLLVDNPKRLFDFD
jgi:2-pyrone-4,6-dicarboxylate lactonase